jgi:hypothetical protein
MRAFGDNAVIIPSTTTLVGGLQVKGDGEGKVISCPSNPEIEGKTILFSERIEYVEYEKYLIIKCHSILAVIR